MTSGGTTVAHAARAIGAGALVAVLAATAALAAPRDTKLVSRQSQGAGGLGADDNSHGPSVSASGRFVAFTTEGTNLGGPIAQTDLNVYVYDRKRRRVQLVSRQSRGAGGQGANGLAHSPSISANGRYVAFQTIASNLGGPVDASNNIYVYDRKRRRVELISRRSRGAGGQGADDGSEDPAISGNGRFVSFQTFADNLGGPINTGANIYVYDRERRRVQLVSRQGKSAGGQGQNDSFADDAGSAISFSGRHVAWMTPATNLGGPIPGGGADVIYVHDRKRKRTQLVSRRSKSAGGQGAGPADAPSISADGRYVAFQIFGDDLGGPANEVSNVYVYDRARRKVRLVSRQGRGAGGAGADSGSSRPSISAGGRYIAFETAADNLGGGPVAGSNIYVYDRKRRRQRLVSRQSPGLGGAPADENSFSAAISGNSLFVAFETQATNLGGPRQALGNVYVHQRR